MNNCECGHVFSPQDLRRGKLTPAPHGHYGGRVTHISEIVCDCGRKYSLMATPFGHGWAVIDAVANERHKSFVCDVCGKTCKNESGLKSHMTTHK